MRALFPLKKKKKKSRLDCDTQIMVDTGTKELAKKLTFAGAVGDVTTDDDDVFFFSYNNPAEKEDAEDEKLVQPSKILIPQDGQQPKKWRLADQRR